MMEFEIEINSQSGFQFANYLWRLKWSFAFMDNFVKVLRIWSEKWQSGIEISNTKLSFCCEELCVFAQYTR